MSEYVQSAFTLLFFHNLFMMHLYKCLRFVSYRLMFIVQ